MLTPYIMPEGNIRFFLSYKQLVADLKQAIYKLRQTNKAVFNFIGLVALEGFW